MFHQKCCINVCGVLLLPINSLNVCFSCWPSQESYRRRYPSITVWEVGNLNEAVGVPKLKLHLKNHFLMFLNLLAANFI